MFIPLVHKRLEFKQEEEIRLIHSVDAKVDPKEFWKTQFSSTGKNININVNNLIDSVYTPPTCDESQIDMVKKIIDKYNFNFQVIKSELSKEPYY
jgi:hypothetical protein